MEPVAIVFGLRCSFSRSVKDMEGRLAYKDSERVVPCMDENIVYVRKSKLESISAESCFKLSASTRTKKPAFQRTNNFWGAHSDHLANKRCHLGTQTVHLWSFVETASSLESPPGQARPFVWHAWPQEPPAPWRPNGTWPTCCFSQQALISRSLGVLCSINTVLALTTCVVWFNNNRRELGLDRSAKRWWEIVLWLWTLW